MSGDTFSICELRTWRDPQPKNFKSLITNYPASSFPIGLNMIDIQAGKNPRVRAYADNVAPADSTFDTFKADFHLGAWHDTVLQSARCSWFDVSKHNALCQFGSLDTGSLSKDTDVVRDISFRKWHFDSTPKVIVWLSAIDISQSHNARIFATATNITPAGFKLHIGTWHTTTVYESTVHWVAIPSDLPNMTTGSFCTQQKGSGPEPTYSQKVTFDKNFKRPPRVLVAFNRLDVGKEDSFRVDASAQGITKEGMTLVISTWGGSILHGAGVSYLAIEEFAPGESYGNTDVSSVRAGSDRQMVARNNMTA